MNYSSRPLTRQALGVFTKYLSMFETVNSEYRFFQLHQNYRNKNMYDKNKTIEIFNKILSNAEDSKEAINDFAKVFSEHGGFVDNPDFTYE
ncbi:MAG TPA: hypothetical protein EYO73_09455 [Sulfurimonas sp.]|nr:hypothetical protein [Sulfurimonas sp.]